MEAETKNLLARYKKKWALNPVKAQLIEDNVVGVQSAKAGGFDVFGFAGVKNKTAFEESGATVFSEISDLCELLGID